MARDAVRVQGHRRIWRFVALGITVMVLSQALINLGVVLGMMPTKGIPLPFISYGGSSLLVMLVRPECFSTSASRRSRSVRAARSAMWRMRGKES